MSGMDDGPSYRCPTCGCFMALTGTCWTGEGGGLEDNYNMECHNNKCPSNRRLTDGKGDDHVPK